jgi:hypothetical protein
MKEERKGRMHRFVVICFLEVRPRYKRSLIQSTYGSNTTMVHKKKKKKKEVTNRPF